MRTDHLCHVSPDIIGVGVATHVIADKAEVLPHLVEGVSGVCADGEGKAEQLRDWLLHVDPLAQLPGLLPVTATCAVNHQGLDHHLERLLVLAIGNQVVTLAEGSAEVRSDVRQVADAHLRAARRQ